MTAVVWDVKLCGLVGTCLWDHRMSHPRHCNCNFYHCENLRFYTLIHCWRFMITAYHSQTDSCNSGSQGLSIFCSTWVISKVLHTVRYLFKNEFILQNTFTGLQCNLHCALSQRSNVWASIVFLSGRLRCWCVWLLGSPHQTLPQCF